jgi:hypothetical protein
MPALGGVPQQIQQDLGGIASEAAKGAIQAGKDIVRGAGEQIVGAPVQQPGVGEDAPLTEEGILSKRAEEKRQFERVRAELDQYIQRKKQQEARIAEERAAQEAARKQQEEEVKERKKESRVAQLLRKVSGRSHGETTPQRE